MSTVILNGAFIGLIYALLGMGLVVIYRGARIINFAYAETGMLAAFVFSSLWLTHHWPLALALGLGLVVSTALGAATEVLVVRPLRHEPPVVAMVATVGVASLLLVFATRTWGLQPKFMQPLLSGAGWRVAGFTIQPTQLLILVVGVLLMLTLGAIYRYTAFGLRLRATALDSDAAAQIGINTELTSMITWGLGGLIAGISAILIAPLVAFHVFFMTGLFARGIAAALIGGLTSLWGAACAGILLGVGEGVIGYVSPITGLTDTLIAVCIIALLLARPNGLVRSAY